MQTKQLFFVEGMHCASCELLIENTLSEVEGVERVEAKLSTTQVLVETTRELEVAELSRLVEEHGYRIVEKSSTNSKVNLKELGRGAIAAGVVIGLFILIQKLGIIDLVGAEQVTLSFVFMIGVVASVSTCMAVVGGLVLSISSNYAKTGQAAKPLIAFHLSRIIGFFVLGGVIGLIGSAFVLTAATTFILNLTLFAVMVIMGLNLLDIFPFTRKLQLKTPKSFGKRVLRLENGHNILTPVILGITTFVLPCGFTQSMQLYSLTTGGFMQGALTMFVYALGTLPVLAAISFASVKLSKTLQSGIFFKAAGFIVLFFALFNFAAALTAAGIIQPLQVISF